MAKKFALVTFLVTILAVATVQLVLADGAVFPLEGKASDYVMGTVANGGKGFHCGINETICGWDYWRPDKGPAKVLAAIDGEVSRCGDGVDIVVVITNSETEVGYLHMERVDVSCGDRVEAGQVIGMTGNRGHSDWNHLHFWVRNLATGQYDSKQDWGDFEKKTNDWSPIDWRARVKQLSPSMLVYGPAETSYPGGIVIHHTVGPSREGAITHHFGEARAPYNVLVDGSEAYLTMDFGRRANHAYCENSSVVAKCNNLNYFAISVVGDFRTDILQPDERQSLVNSIRWALDHGVPAVIKGHRDVGSTECPGDNLYNLLPELLAEAQKGSVSSTTLPTTLMANSEIGAINSLPWLLALAACLLVAEYIRLRWRYWESLKIVRRNGFEVVMAKKRFKLNLLVLISGVVLVLLGDSFSKAGFGLIVLAVLVTITRQSRLRFLEVLLTVASWTVIGALAKAVADTGEHPKLVLAVLLAIPTSLILDLIKVRLKLWDIKRAMRKHGALKPVAQMRLLRMPAWVFWPFLVGLGGLCLFWGYKYFSYPLKAAGWISLGFLPIFFVESRLKKLLEKKNLVWPWFDPSRLVSAVAGWAAVIFLLSTAYAMNLTGLSYWQIPVELPVWLFAKETVEVSAPPSTTTLNLEAWQVIASAAKEEPGCPPGLIYGYWKTETNVVDCQPYRDVGMKNPCLSSAGAQGPLQFMPETWLSYADSSWDKWKLYDSTRATCRMTKKLNLWNQPTRQAFQTRSAGYDGGYVWNGGPDGYNQAGNVWDIWKGLGPLWSTWP